MNTKNSLLALAAFAAASLSASAGTFANISTLDESFSDWDGISASFTDPSGDGAPGDINQIFIANNDTHLFIRVTFYTPVNPNAGLNPEASGGNHSLFIGIDNDSNTNTGFNVYGLGLVGTEAAWQNDFAFEQAAGVFNTDATTSNANASISPFFTTTLSQEISIARNAVIDTTSGQQAFPNSSFNLALYFNGGSSDDFAGAVAYTFATAAVPEPSTFALLAATGALGLAVCRRRRK